MLRMKNGVNTYYKMSMPLQILSSPEACKNLLCLLDRLERWGQKAYPYLKDAAVWARDSIKNIGEGTKDILKKLIQKFKDLLSKKSWGWKIGSIICGIIATLICMASIYDDFAEAKKGNKTWMQSMIGSGVVVVGTTMGGVIGHLISPVLGIGYGMFIGALIGAGIKRLIS